MNEGTLKSKVVVTSCRKIEGKHVTVGGADLAINGEFAISGLIVVRRDTGLAVKFPWRVEEKKGGEKEYLDVCYPLSLEARQAVSSLVIQEFETKYGEGLAT